MKAVTDAFQRRHDYVLYSSAKVQSMTAVFFFFFGRRLQLWPKKKCSKQ